MRSRPWIAYWAIFLYHANVSWPPYFTLDLRDTRTKDVSMTISNLSRPPLLFSKRDCQGASNSKDNNLPHHFGLRPNDKQSRLTGYHMHTPYHSSISSRIHFPTSSQDPAARKVSLCSPSNSLNRTFPLFSSLSAFSCCICAGGTSMSLFPDIMSTGV